MSYKHITPFQQNEIAVLLRVGTAQKDIAKNNRSDSKCYLATVDRISTTTAKIIHDKLEKRFDKMPKSRKFTYTELILIILGSGVATRILMVLLER